MRVTELSVSEIRERWVLGEEPITPRLLGRLKRDPREGVRRIYAALARRHERERVERERADAMLHFERVLWRSGLTRVAGVDEVGVGPMAGPVVAAAVVFPPGTEISEVDDSKRLDAETRARLETRIRARAAGIGVGLADVAEIDRLNVYHAALLAMRRAVEALPEPPEHLLVDARSIPGIDVPQNAFQKGDGIDFSIAAASIVAKTHRDRLMAELDAAYPEYGFARHKGYCTRAHQEAVRRHGPCALHRRSYSFIGELCGEYSELFYELLSALEGRTPPARLEAVERRIEEHAAVLSEREQRKLRVVLQRRWKIVR